MNQSENKEIQTAQNTVENAPLIEVKNLKQYFNININAFQTKPLKAVDGVSFSINKGETLGLVGESGCGKTTVGRTLLQLYKPTDGQIFYRGKEIVTKADIKAGVIAGGILFIVNYLTTIGLEMSSSTNTAKFILL